MKASQEVLLIRLSEMKDAGCLMELDHLVWDRNTAPEPLVWTSREQYLLHCPPGSQLVAFTGDVLCGYVGFRSPSGLASQRHVKELNIAVHPSYRRQGIGRQLIEAAWHMARRAGVAKLRLRVLSCNPGALAFYQACGFQEEGRLSREFEVDGRFVDEIWMCLFV